MDQENNGENYTLTPQYLDKTKTNIEGLDQVLHGGLPTGQLTIFKGGPGTGKTVIGLNITVNNASSGIPSLFISFEETLKSIHRNALSMGWNLEQMEKDEKISVVAPEIDFEAVITGNYNLKGLLAILEGEMKRIGVNLIVIDALDALLSLFENQSHVRNQLVILYRWLRKHNITTVLTVKDVASVRQNYAFLDFMADCVIELDQRIYQQITTRRLNVIKYRGSDFASREHPIVITEKGLAVMPISLVDLVHQSIGEFTSTHNDRLDEVLGGGFRRASSILISGPSGSGKTTLAFSLVVPAAERNEKVLYLSFEQSEEAIVSEMEGIGFALESLIKKGRLRIRSVMPESQGIEEHLYNILQETDEYNPEHIVIDAVSATNRIGTSKAAAEFLIRLYHAAKKRGITCIYTNQTISSRHEHLEISGVGISSLIDTAILLHYYRRKDRIGRSLLVLKSRGTLHSDRYHNFSITDRGIVIEEPVKNEI